MQNHLKGLLLLADCYPIRKGVEQSIPEALKNYKSAADQGDVSAQYLFAKFVLQNKINEYEQDQAGHYFKLAIKNNPLTHLLALCENDLAKCFENGTGVQKSMKKAVGYYTLGSNHGNVDAQNQSGFSERSGYNVVRAHGLRSTSKPQNFAMAFAAAILLKFK